MLSFSNRYPHRITVCFKDGIMPSSNAASGVLGWTMNPDFSQLWNEQGFIHCLRMVAMGINHRFQEAVKKVRKRLLTVFCLPLTSQQ